MVPMTNVDYDGDEPENRVKSRTCKSFHSGVFLLARDVHNR